MKKTIIALSLTSLLMACGSQNHRSKVIEPSTQAQLDKIAATLDIKYSVLLNQKGHCQATGLPTSDDKECYVVRVDLTAANDINTDDWALYFSQVDPLKMPVNDEFKVNHVNGDLHTLAPGKNFKGLKAGETASVEFIVRNYHVAEAEYMPNIYIAAAGLTAKTVISTQFGVDPETGLETRPYTGELTDYAKTFKNGADDATQLATSSYLYKKYQQIKLDHSVIETGLIPKPSRLMVTEAGQLDLARGIKLINKGIDLSEVTAAVDYLARLGIKQTENGIPVELYQGRDKRKRNKGSYQLTIAPTHIRIAAWDDEGAANAINSIAGLLSLNETTLPLVKIEDEPRYEYRGMHVDVARNFHSKQFILDLLNQMAAYKLNKLHLHLGDDEGWRLEIKDLPELTDIGSKRCHDVTEDSCLLPQLGSGPTGLTQVDGYYSIADYIDIVKAAEARHIQVIPSFDMPGHSRAVIKAMEARYRKFMAAGNKTAAEQYLLTDYNDTTEYESIQFYNDNTINVCMDSTYAFLDKVMDEMKIVHQQAGQPLTRYHIGADETAGAWKASPVCNTLLENNDLGLTEPAQLGSYFIERVSQLLADKDIEVAGWSDGMGHTQLNKMPKVVQSNSWGVLPWGGHKGAHKQANNGWEVILSTPDALYFDFPYEADPKEAGYSWASRHVETRKVFQFMPDNLPIHAEIWDGPDGKPFTVDDREQKDDMGKITHQPLLEGKRFAGMQAQIWSETIRSDDQTEYQVFPRLLAVAERAWHRAEWEVPYNYAGALYNRQSGVFNNQLQAQQQQDWHRFVNVLSVKALAKLDADNIAYRVPTVGAVIEDNYLKANVVFPSLAIEYRIAQGPWQAYTQPVKLTANQQPIEVRAIAADGKRKGRSLIVN